MNPAGKHLIIEARGDIASLTSGELDCLTQQAASSTGATILFSHFHPFGEGQGSTGVVVLAESHMTVHTWPEWQYAAFDIFVCGDCDPYKAVEVLQESHPNSVFHVNSLKRGIGQTVGRFIDHIPSDNPATEQEQYKRTLDIYVSLFGQPDQLF